MSNCAQRQMKRASNPWKRVSRSSVIQQSMAADALTEKGAGHFENRDFLIGGDKTHD